MREFVEIACYFIFAMMWNLLAGYGGMVSIGAAPSSASAATMMLVLGNFAGLNPFVAILLGALAAGLVAVPVSFVAFRLSGGYFAIGTRVIAEVFRRLSFANVSAVGGGFGHHADGAARHRARPRASASPTGWRWAAWWRRWRWSTCSCAASAASRCWRSATTRWRPSRRACLWRA